MRVVSGKLKGRRFELPSSKWKTRPTTDYAKESLFNILSNWIELDAIKVLDLFAGTGNLSYEFVSRGATQVLAVDQFPACVKFIQKQAKLFDISDQIMTQRIDVFKFISLHRAKYDLIFADPPYDHPKFHLLPDLILDRELLNEDALLIIEHDMRNNFEKHKNCIEVRQYGQSYFSFFKHKV